MVEDPTLNVAFNLMLEKMKHQRPKPKLDFVESNKKRSHSPLNNNK